MPLRSNGEEIRKRRQLLGLSATEFAQRAGYSLNHVSQIELGHSNAGPRFLRIAAELFGCQVSDLLTEEDAETTEEPETTEAGAA